MALVSYDYGSDSENEGEEDSKTILDSTNGAEENSNDIGSLLSELPKSKPQEKNILDDKLEDFIPKYQPTVKAQKKVKITIPSLSQFQEDDEDEEEAPLRKKIKTTEKGSSLLALLPPVRGSPLTNKSFIPKTVKNKPQQLDKQIKGATTSSRLVPNSVRKKAEIAKKTALKKLTKDGALNAGEESDDDIDVPETFDEEMWQKVCGRPTKSREVDIVPPPEDTEEFPELAQSFDSAPEPEKPYDGLDNAAFKELVGKSRRPVNIKLIDINEEEILPEKDVWMAKSLTDPDQAPPPVIDNPVDPTRKKKHHITYLAEQAKAKEEEFKSQWASSRFNRNQTRAKYGF